MSRVRELLQACGLLGAPLAENRFLAGEEFFRFITFAGCSPYLQLEPPPGGGLDFCHLSLHQDEYPPVLRIAPQRSRPRCPACRQAVAGWTGLLDAWQHDPLVDWHCDHCGNSVPVAELDWRRYGLAARQRVEIHQVHAGEALPGDNLLALLSEETDRSWDYAWAASGGGPGALR